MQLKWSKFEDAFWNISGEVGGLEGFIIKVRYNTVVWNLIYLPSTIQSQTCCLPPEKHKQRTNNCSMSSLCHHHAAGRANLQENVPDGNKTTAGHSRTLLWVFKPWFWTLMWQKRGGSDWENEGNCMLMQRLVSHTVHLEKIIVSVKMQKQLPCTVKNDRLGVTARSH